RRHRQPERPALDARVGAGTGRPRSRPARRPLSVDLGDADCVRAAPCSETRYRPTIRRLTGKSRHGENEGSDRGGDVAVLGAGPAGLTAAYVLARRGRSASVFEADAGVGRLATTVDVNGDR